MTDKPQLPNGREGALSLLNVAVSSRESREGGLERHTGRGCARCCRRPSYHDPRKFPHLL